MLISSSDAVRKIIGTLEVCRTILQKSKPEPSGRETSRTSRSYRPFGQMLPASFIVLAMSSSNPCFLNARESPLTRLKSSSKSNILLMIHTFLLFFITGKLIITTGDTIIYRMAGQRQITNFRVFLQLSSTYLPSVTD